ncbi:MAG TPA: hypothetical protein VN688_08720 [Gemmataceae bacterium]|nr:hypothetical protein [Gemmataceae bacterium]
MDTGELLTRWTVRLALALYVLGLVLRWSAGGRRSWRAGARLAWTGGCLAFLLHVVCAFAFYHHWSHANAYAATARGTAAVVGWDSGAGLYVNYAFGLVWLADVAWWWRGLENYEARPRVIEWTVQGFLAFIAFNATVVFAEGRIRWISLVVCLFLLLFRGWLLFRWWVYQGT